MRKIIYILGFILFLILTFQACRKDTQHHIPTPYNLKIPSHFPPMIIPEDNPMTVEGVALGRKLFYDPILSSDLTISCGTCHRPDVSFSDDATVSTGVNGQKGKRNSMALVNLGWQDFFFWDGRAQTLEEQVFHPVRDPSEMNLDWSTAEKRLIEDDEYPELFHQAFGEEGIDSVKTSKAIAQFLRTLISGESKFDYFYKRIHGFEMTDAETQKSFFTAEEITGYGMFLGEQGDCSHCHSGPLIHNNLYSNNGLDMVFEDEGLGGITGFQKDMGRFKVPTLRNIALTAPYMHDGRFETLDEVLKHYNSGLVKSPTIDPNMKKVDQGGIGLQGEELMMIKSFLHTLTDENFINNPDFQPPED